MKIIIEGEPKEIAALIATIQGQLKPENHVTIVSNAQGANASDR